MSTIASGNTVNTAFTITGDTTGNLVFTTQAGTNTLTLPNVTGTLAVSAAPNVTVYTSGSGNYSTPANAKFLYVRMVGGGSSGGTNAADPVSGGNTTFGTSFLVCNGGASGGGGGISAAGGSATGGDINITGSAGQGSNNNGTQSGGAGGNSPFGGAGGASTSGAAGTNAAASITVDKTTINGTGYTGLTLGSTSIFFSSSTSTIQINAEL
jgi:hypothetical protein